MDTNPDRGDPDSDGVGKPRPTSDRAAVPEREHLHRLRDVWLKNPIYFITCCVAQRRHLLADELIVNILVAAFRNSPEFHGWSVGRYVIMPDHVHFFARPQPEAKTLGAFLRDWKKWTTREIGSAAHAAPPLWQPEFFDHALRSPESYSEKWDYVRLNPVRAGLVATPEEWPFAGECELLSF